MARFAIINSSELGDRWDADFHITRHEHKRPTAELEKLISAEDCVRRVKALAFEDKKPLAPLIRGSRTYLDNAKLDRAAEQYPHLALAILEANAPAMKARVQAEIAASMALLDAIERLAEPAPEIVNQNLPVIELKVDKSDLGKVIGKQGRTARALRTILNAASTKLRKRSVLEIIE